MNNNNNFFTKSIEVKHSPVMLTETIDIIKPTNTKVILDSTFGRGGHTKELLKYGAQIHAMDRDPDAFRSGLHIQSICPRFAIHWSLFSESLHHFPARSFDAILFDFGLSSTQIADESTGISFNSDSPLNMSMGRSKRSAYEFVNFADEDLIVDVLFRFGEEKRAKIIAKHIVARRKRLKFTMTLDLANLIRSAVPRQGKDQATQTFQAIRMYVNNELDEIMAGLENAQRLVKLGGLIVTISFHSLEDRIVKDHFRQFQYKSKAIFPSRAEVCLNRRSRSAKMRWARIT